MIRKGKKLPAFYFVLTMVAMLLLHALLPVWRWTGDARTGIGVAFLLLGVALVLAAYVQFQKHDTPIEPYQPPNALVTSGIYRVSRNPIYLALVCILVGIAVAKGSASPLVAIAVFVWKIQTTFIADEERRLEAHFGDAFRAYRQSVRRWV